MDFCQQFGPEIAYCLKQPLRGCNVSVTCVRTHSLVSMGSNGCGLCVLAPLAQYTTVLIGLQRAHARVCVCTSSLPIDRWMEDDVGSLV